MYQLRFFVLVPNDRIGCGSFLFCSAVAKQRKISLETGNKEKQGEKKLLKDLIKTVLLERKKLQNIRVLDFPWRRMM